MATNPACFTVVTKNYLPYARALMSRLALVEPTASRYVFMADEIEGYFVPEAEEFAVVPCDEYVAADELRRMTFQYTGFELSNALKAHAHRYLHRQTQHGLWLYYDSDIFPLTSCLALLEKDTEALIFLSPHILRAADASTIDLETNFLWSGIYNGGLLGVRRSPQTANFIEWFIERMATHGFNCYRHTFVDQLWLNLVPILFNKVHVIRHPGVNIGYWNLHERPVTEEPVSTFTVDGVPVVFVHFSGWDADQPEQLSRHRVSVVPNAAVRKLLELYRQQMIAAGLPSANTWPYSWANYEDGRAIQLGERRRYADELLAGGWADGASPFANPQRLIDPPPTFGQRVKRRWNRLFILGAMYGGFLSHFCSGAIQVNQ